ncbi:MAG: DUF126 domain-containing protein [Rhodobacteraceae bacterium]|nr:DUF126 domain-containing protein [Paracoccaceae bacterium]
MSKRKTEWEGRGIVKGIASGLAIVSNTAFSFLGDVDIRTGTVVGQSNDLLGRCIKGLVLVVPATRGSAGAWRFLYQLKVHGTHPVAIVTNELPDPSVVQGAILSNIPIVSLPLIDLHKAISSGCIIEVDGITGKVRAL